VIFVAIAIILFLLKGQYSGPYRVLIYSYGGNVTVSFAFYFVFLKLCMMSPRLGRLIAAGAVLACVESFELLDGFGFTANVYDPFDLLANAVGVGCALGLDTTLQMNRSRNSEVNPR